MNLGRMNGRVSVHADAVHAHWRDDSKRKNRTKSMNEHSSNKALMNQICRRKKGSLCL